VKTVYVTGGTDGIGRGLAAGYILADRPAGASVAQFTGFLGIAWVAYRCTYSPYPA
jgi:hypothetical protein